MDLSKDYFSRILKDFIVHRAKARYTQVSIPNPASEFHCYRIGNLEIPVTPVVGSPETPFHLDEVTIHFQPLIKEQQPDYPLELRAARQYLIEETERKYGLKTLGDDDIMPRLDKIEQGPEIFGDKRGHLNIYLSLTTFYSLAATNRGLEYRVIPASGLVSRFTSNQTIREAYCLPPYHDLSKSLLANAPGVEVAVISRSLSQNPKDQLIVRRRSQDVLFFRGYYQVSATGYMSLAHRDSNDNPNPFITAITEAKQEIADSLSLLPEDFNLVGVSIKWEDLHPAFYGYIETGRTVHELLGDFKRDSYEGTLSAIPFDPKSVLSHIIKEKWTAPSALTTISTLLAFYPRREIEAIARTLPAKEWKDFIETL